MNGNNAIRVNEIDKIQKFQEIGVVRNRESFVGAAAVFYGWINGPTGNRGCSTIGNLIEPLGLRGQRRRYDYVAGYSIDVEWLEIWIVEAYSLAGLGHF